MVGFLLLAVAGALLWVGAELFVTHASSAARSLRTSGLAVGLLLAGAEPEELITALIAGLRGRGGIAAGGAIGANVTMLTLVVGLAVLARPLRVTARLRRYLVGTAALGAAAALVVPGGLGRTEAGVLVALYVAAVAAVWRTERRVPLIGELAEGERERQAVATIRGVVPALGGVAVMGTGGWVAVIGAERLVDALGATDSVVGLSLVALATTAELLALTVSARRHRVGELAVAGILGSASYNATATLGVAGLVRPLDTSGVETAAWLAVGLPLLLMFVSARRSRIGRVAGAVLVGSYLVYLGWLYGAVL